MKKKEKTTSEVAFLMGICILPVGTLGYTAGLASPYQRFGRDGAGVRKVYGLWTTCDQVSGDLVNCQDNVLTVGDWLRVAQFLQTFGALLLLLACVLLLVFICTTKLFWKRLLDLASSFGAALAFFGSLCYFLITLTPTRAEDLSYTWGFALNVTGMFISILAAILITAGAPGPKEEEEEKKGEKQGGTEKGEKPVWMTGRPPSSREKGGVVPRGEGFPNMFLVP